MSMLLIKTYPDPILQKRAEEIKKITPEIIKLADDMIETMVEREGVGLAGPQVGVPKRIIVVQTENGPAAFVNPKIIKMSKKTGIMQEGCLSLPGIWLEVPRMQSVEIEALDLRAKKIKVKTKGFMARIFQHEIDHLDGVLIRDLAH